MSWVLAIDFGTAVTAAATMQLGGPAANRPIPVEVAGSWRVPSGVLRLDTGQLVVGMMAERQAAMRIEAYEPTPKRRMGEGVMDLGGPVPVTEAIGAVLRVMAAEASRNHGGSRPEAVCLTHPATWAGPRLNALREAARLAGLPGVLFLPEPVAAACWYAATSGRVPAGGRVAVYDLGGGTFDAAVVESNGDGTFTTVGRPVGVDPLGGVDFDFALLDLVGATIEQRDPQLWEGLENPAESSERRRRRALLSQVRSLKEDLSTVTQSALLVPETAMEVTVTRDEFEAAIAPEIQRSAVVLEETIAAAGMTAPALAAVYLVGGSSRIPLVEDVIAKRLGVTPATLDEPKQVVAFGAATHIARSWKPAASPASRQALRPRTPPRPRPAWQPPPAAPKKSKANLLVAGLVAAVLVLAGVTLTVVLMNKGPDSTTATDNGSADGGGDTGVTMPPAEPPGDLSGFAGFDQLAQDCHAGVMVSCQDLYLQSPVGSGYESYGASCGERQDGTSYTDGQLRPCVVFEQDLAANSIEFPDGVPPEDLAGDGHEQFDLLAQGCYDGDMASCDQLYDGSPAGSEYGNYGNTCGRRIAAADVELRLCTDIFG